jgi:two-component system sensor kinase FixL
MDASFFRDLVARSRDAIITIDTDSRVLFANDGVERTLGYDPDELEGGPLTEMMPERYQERHAEAIERYVTEGERQLDWDSIELPALHADGHEVPLSIAFEEHEYEGERVFTGIMRDISDRLERTERLERKNEQLERFAAIVSHDLRDPLNTAQATLTLLEARAEEEGRSTDYIDDLDAALHRMDVLIEGVLTLTKSGLAVGATAPVDLATVSRRAWDLAGEDAATLTLETEGLTVEADEERLRALLENLFRNSVQHGSTGGRSETADDTGGDGAGTAAPTVRVEVGVLRAENADQPTGFYVADDGPGIPPDEREAVFERGHTSTEGGTGLGLNIVQMIAEAHGWSVTLTESEQGGARFEFDVTGE